MAYNNNTGILATQNRKEIEDFIFTQQNPDDLAWLLKHKKFIDTAISILMEMVRKNYKKHVLLNCNTRGIEYQGFGGDMRWEFEMHDYHKRIVFETDDPLEVDGIEYTGGRCIEYETEEELYLYLSRSDTYGFSCLGHLFTSGLENSEWHCLTGPYYILNGEPQYYIYGSLVSEEEYKRCLQPIEKYRLLNLLRNS